jgi:hypothetical protein
MCLVGAALAVTLLHPVLTYSTQIYPDLPAALAVLLVAELLVRPPTALRLAATSALLGAIPWLTIRGWFPVAGMGLVVAWLALRPLAHDRSAAQLRRVLAAALPFSALVLALAALDLRMFGLFLPNAGYLLIRDAQPVLTYTPQLGIPGLFLDRTFGLLSRAPVYALACYGAVPLLRRARALRSPALVALFLGWLAYLVYIGDIAYWWADGSPSSRYQLATIALPLVAFAAGLERLLDAPARERTRDALPRVLLAIAAGWTAAVTVLFALLPQLRYDLAADMRDGGPGQLWVFVTKVLRADPGLLFPSLVRAAPADALLAVAWLAALAALVALGARRPDPPPILAA